VDPSGAALSPTAATSFRDGSLVPLSCGSVGLASKAGSTVARATAAAQDVLQDCDARDRSKSRRLVQGLLLNPLSF
jgi:hypothetical protein